MMVSENTVLFEYNTDYRFNQPVPITLILNVREIPDPLVVVASCSDKKVSSLHLLVLVLVVCKRVFLHH